MNTQNLCHQGPGATLPRAVRTKKGWQAIKRMEVCRDRERRILRAHRISRRILMSTAELASTKPEDLGIDSEKLEAVFARAKRDVDDGTLKSAQVAVARHGKLAGVRTFGTVQHNGVEAEVPATDQTLYTIFSCTKAIVGAAT